MSFREKSAWVSFLTILLVAGWYFTTLARFAAGDPMANPWENPELSRHFFWALGAIVVLEVVLHGLIALRRPRDILTPTDERERLIALEAHRVAYWVLVALAVLASFLIVHHRPVGLWFLGNLLLFMIAVSELTRFGSQIVHHLRDR